MGPLFARLAARTLDLSRSRSSPIRIRTLFVASRHFWHHEVRMHHHAIGVLLLFASATLLHSQEQVPNPAEELYSLLLTKGLVTLRYAALRADCAYLQVAHLTDNLSPGAVGSTLANAT